MPPSKPYPLKPSDIPPEELAEIIRKHLSDPESQRRAARLYADGLVDDAIQA